MHEPSEFYNYALHQLKQSVALLLLSTLEHIHGLFQSTSLLKKTPLLLLTILIHPNNQLCLLFKACKEWEKSSVTCFKFQSHWALAIERVPKAAKSTWNTHLNRVQYQALDFHHVSVCHDMSFADEWVNILWEHSNSCYLWLCSTLQWTAMLTTIPFSLITSVIICSSNVNEIGRALSWICLDLYEIQVHFWSNYQTFLYFIWLNNLMLP